MCGLNQTGEFIGSGETARPAPLLFFILVGKNINYFCHTPPLHGSWKMSDKPGLPDCMMPDGGDCCAYVAWQADALDAKDAEIAQLEARTHNLVEESITEHLSWSAEIDAKDAEIERLRPQQDMVDAESHEAGNGAPMTYALFKDGKQVGEWYWTEDACFVAAYCTGAVEAAGSYDHLSDGYEIREVEE